MITVIFFQLYFFGLILTKPFTWIHFAALFALSLHGIALYQVRRLANPIASIQKIASQLSTTIRFLLGVGRYFHPDLILYGLTLGNDVTESYVRLYPNFQFKVQEKSDDEPPNLELNPHPDSQASEEALFPRDS